MSLGTFVTTSTSRLFARFYFSEISFTFISGKFFFHAWMLATRFFFFFFQISWRGMQDIDVHFYTRSNVREFGYSVQ